MGVSNSDEHGGRVDGNGSEGNSSSRQGAGTEIFVPQNLSSMAAELRNFSWMEADVLGFSRRGEYIGERVMSVGGQGPHT